MMHGHDEIADRMGRQRAEQNAQDRERAACAVFLEMLADFGAYAAQNNGALAETLRKIASHMREREKWEEIIKARMTAKKPLPWEAT